MNGFLNAGTSTDLLLAVGGCPTGPIPAGYWFALMNTFGWEFCLGGNNVAVDCTVIPSAYPNDHIGFTNNSPIPAPCCYNFGFCGTCIPISIESESWGSIKSMYR